jgi:Sulfotransferase family
MMTSSTTPVPNFFIVGAPKAGTTSLYHYLGQHPEIYMSPLKEPSYFSLEVRSENFEPHLQIQMEREEEAVRRYLAGPMNHQRFSGIVREWEDYLRLFASAHEGGSIGEASVCYLWSKSAAGAIASRLPQARIIIILRDPAERAFSQYLHNVSNGVVRDSFSAHIDSSLRYVGNGFGILNPFLEIGMYADQVKRYLDMFPSEQVGIWFYEETTRRPREFLSEVLGFLGVDAGFVADTSTKHLQPQIPRGRGISQALRRNGMWDKVKTLTPDPLKPFVRSIAYRKNGSVKMTDRDRKFLVDYYKEDICKLAGILNCDLSDWLR